MSKPKLTPKRAEFIDANAALLVSIGMPRSLARLFSYLMLCPEPVSLDDLCDELQIAKSSASVAARLLESAKLVRRHSQSGTKRVLYSLPDNPASILAEQQQSLGQMAKLLQQFAPEVAEGMALERMHTIADFYQTIQSRMAEVMESFASSRLADD